MLRADGAALLQHRDDIPTIQDPGLWVMPGGHLEPGESPAEAAVREFAEETHYRCDKLQPLVQLRGAEAGCADNQELIFFWAQYDGRQPIECLEGQALRFVRREQVGNLPRRDYLTEVWDLALAARRDLAA